MAQIVLQLDRTDFYSWLEMLPKSGTVVKMQHFIFSEAPCGTAVAVLPHLSPLLAVAANHVSWQSDANKVNYKITHGDPTRAQQTVWWYYAHYVPCGPCSAVNYQMKKASAKSKALRCSSRSVYTSNIFCWRNEWIIDYFDGVHPELIISLCACS